MHVQTSLPCLISINMFRRMPSDNARACLSEKSAPVHMTSRSTPPLLKKKKKKTACVILATARSPSNPHQSSSFCQTLSSPLVSSIPFCRKHCQGTDLGVVMFRLSPHTFEQNKTTQKRKRSFSLPCIPTVFTISRQASSH